MIELEDRVVHLADRRLDTPVHGTVQQMMTREGTAYARVLWDDQDYPKVHPVANLVKIEGDL